MNSSIWPIDEILRGVKWRVTVMKEYSICIKNKDWSLTIRCSGVSYQRHLITWLILVQTISKFNSIYWNNSKFCLMFKQTPFLFQWMTFLYLHRKIKHKINLWVILRHAVKFEIIWTKIGQVFRLRNYIDFSETACLIWYIEKSDVPWSNSTRKIISTIYFIFQET